LPELLGLKWLDFDFEGGQINLCRGIVLQKLSKIKNEASRKPLPPFDSLLAGVLLQWRALCPYNKPRDYVFASPTMRGTQPTGRPREWKIASSLQRSEQK
jgi:integrase